MPNLCKSCGAVLIKGALGRPRSYCSDACRRAAELEVRRAARAQKWARCVKFGDPEVPVTFRRFE
jgi:hypothetical protein